MCSVIILMESKNLIRSTQFHRYIFTFFFFLLTFEFWVTKTTHGFLLADQQRPHDH